jgi:hypothetical protein
MRTDGMDADRESRLEILMEAQGSTLAAMLESISVLPSINDRLTHVEADTTAIKAEQVVHREILRELKADVKDLKQVLAGHLETAH